MSVRHQSYKLALVENAKITPLNLNQAPAFAEIVSGSVMELLLGLSAPVTGEFMNTDGRLDLPPTGCTIRSVAPMTGEMPFRTLNVHFVSRGPAATAVLWAPATLFLW